MISRAIAAEQGYDQILDGTVAVPSDFVEDPEDDEDHIQADHLKAVNKRGYVEKLLLMIGLISYLQRSRCSCLLLCFPLSRVAC